MKYIYGAGSYGEWVYRLYPDSVGFLDRNDAIDTFMGLPVRRAEDKEFPREDSTVIVALVLPYKEREEVFAFIRSCGFENIVDAQSLRCHYVGYDNSDEGMWEGIDLFADEHSLHIYCEHVAAHISRDYGHCVESIGSIQYFPDYIPLRYERFIDCGAYTGDTVQKVIELKDIPEAVAMFEPVSFEKLMKPTSVSELYLFPCAVSDKTRMVSMAAEGGSSYMSTGEGGQCAMEGRSATGRQTGAPSLAPSPSIMVQAVALDDVIPTFAPTFIKMDIEGAEMKALRGAQQIISRYRPDLAISVYHCVNHLWDVPLLINSWGLGYRFWLKCHNSFTMETVLYATT